MDLAVNAIWAPTPWSCLAADIRAESSGPFIDRVRQHTNAARITPSVLEGRRSLELVEDRAAIWTAGKAGRTQYWGV
jgi:hypothetical protein